MLSLGVVDPDVEVGDGTDAGVGRGKRRHEESRPSSATSRLEIRAVVSPVPYSKVVRETYAEGWRTAAKQ